MTQTQTLLSKDFARQMYWTADEFYQTYAVIERVQFPAHDFIAIKHFLLCHALELALKSLLVDTGNYNEKMLKDKFGHDLEKLANRVKQEYGSVSEVDACEDYIQALNPDYRSKGYEYPINGGRFIGMECDKFSLEVKGLIQACERGIASYIYPDKPLP